MAIPKWLKVVGRIAIDVLREYGTPPAPAPQVVPFPTPPSPPPAVPPPPPAPVDARPQLDMYVYDTYRLAPPEGMNRFPDDTEWRSDTENVQKYGREWLRKNMYQRNGAPYPPKGAA